MGDSGFRVQGSGFRKTILFLLFPVFCALYPVPCTLILADDKPSSGELITKAWDAHGKKDVEATFRYAQQCIELYKEEAAKQQASLKAFPPNKPDILNAQALNDVGTAYFIQGESFRDQGKTAEAIKAFKVVIYDYCYAQAWDPRGWYWKVAKTSWESVLQLNPKERLPACPCGVEVSGTAAVNPAVVARGTKIVLYDSGREDAVNYEKYGEFKNSGTEDYKYIIKDQEGLSAAVGEGIFPNTTSVRWDPKFKLAQKEKRLEGRPWDFVNSPDLEAAFFKWATCSEPPGIRLFYTAFILEKAGLIKHAVKCYYAIVVHYPASYGWTYWHTPWYVGQAAIAKINYLLRENPQLGLKLEGADIKIINGHDHDLSNDTAVVKPGRLVKVSLLEKFKPKPSPDLISVKRRLGKGKAHLIQYETGDWRLIVDGKPFIIQGVTYTPTKVGESPDNQTQTNWMVNEFNRNGII